MNNYTLNDLKRQTKKDVEGHKARIKNRYALAKALGFSPAEARILSFKSEKTIKGLAVENGKTNETRD